MASAMAIVRSSVFALVLLAAVSQTHAQTCNTTLLAAVLATPELSQLAAVVNASGLAGTLAGLDNVTVIAPNNAAFNGTGGLYELLRANNLTLEQVTAPGSNRAASILLYHVVTAVATAEQLRNNQVLPTALEGYTLEVRKGGESNVTIVGKANNATVVVADVRVCNSIVHVVNRVLLPEANLTAIPVPNTTAGPSPAVPTPPGVPSPPSAVVPPPPGGNGTSDASTLGAGPLVFGLSGAVAAALLL